MRAVEFCVVVAFCLGGCQQHPESTFDFVSEEAEALENAQTLREAAKIVERAISSRWSNIIILESGANELIAAQFKYGINDWSRVWKHFILPPAGVKISGVQTTGGVVVRGTWIDGNYKFDYDFFIDGPLMGMTVSASEKGVPIDSVWVTGAK